MKAVRGDNHGHPALWATLTIAAFPSVAMILDAQGVDPFRSFAGGAAASLLMLLLEGAVRGRWWISEPAVAEVLEDPKLGWRLLALTGIVILMFQSVVLVGFLADRSMDTKVVRFVLGRQCDNPNSHFLARLCRVEAQDSRTDAAVMAIREAAEKRFFGHGFVTCAVRPLASVFQPTSCVQGALIRCDRWMIGTITRTPVSVESIERTVVTGLSMMSDGSYRVDGWSDDPSSSAWKAVGGDIGEQTLSQPTDVLERKREDLKTETFRRAIERLQIK